MFTGLVQCVGTVRSLVDGRLVIDPPIGAWGDPLQLGESIAVNGCCLTVIDTSDGVGFDLSEETLKRTSFGQLAPGRKVNLERAMRPMDRFGGHIVQGHVDATAELVSVKPHQYGQAYRFRVDPNHERYLIDKGSIALDGISLTVVDPDAGEFDVWMIPHTLSHTNLRDLSPGERLNVEFDVLVKHVAKLVEHGGGREWLQAVTGQPG